MKKDPYIKKISPTVFSKKSQGGVMRSRKIIKKYDENAPVRFPHAEYVSARGVKREY